MAQVVRFAMGFAAFIALLLVAVLVVTIDGNINRWIIFVSSTLVAVMLGDGAGHVLIRVARHEQAVRGVGSANG